MSDTVLTYDVFLSYNWREHAAVEAVARVLRDRGLRVFLDRWYLKNTARVWLWRTKDLTEEACAHLTRNFKEDEWSRYLHEEIDRKTCPNLP